MSKLIYIVVALILFMSVTAQAKWIAKTDISTKRYDSYGKYERTDVSKKALGAYDKASACLQYLQRKFNKSQKDMAELKSVINKDDPNSYWFKIHFPFIESKMFTSNKIVYHEIEHFSCEEEQE